MITAIAMTEPGTGSDLQGIKTRAVKEGDHYVLNGSKTFITNGINADLVIVVARPTPTRARWASRCSPSSAGWRGFERGRHLDKMGLDAQDTAELSFTDVKVPAENLIGGGHGVHLPDGEPAAGASRSPSWPPPQWRRCSTKPSVHQGRKAFGKTDRLLPEQPVPAGRAGHRATAVRIMTDGSSGCTWGS